MTKKMNKIEKYIRLAKKAHKLLRERRISEAMPYIAKGSEIAKNYRVEDLVREFDSIGYKVNINELTKRILGQKKRYEVNGRDFNDEAIGQFLLYTFAPEYAERRGE